MKHIKTFTKLFEASQELNSIHKGFLDSSIAGTWVINNTTGLVDIDGNFDCTSTYIKDFKGIKFGDVSGYFYCSYNSLISLEGAPRKVGGDFNCSVNELTTLEGAPQEVGQDFSCVRNNITSLEGATQKVGRNFYCTDNKLTTLEGAPTEIIGVFYCAINKLTSLKGVPEKIGETFLCDQFKCTDGDWSFLWAIDNIEKYPILETILSPEIIQNKIDDNPAKAVIALKKIWKKIKKDPKYRSVEFPLEFKKGIELVSDLSDLGI